MKADWELLAEEPDDVPDGPAPWWRVHVPTLLGAMVMALAAGATVAGAAADGTARSWVAAMGFVVNAVALVGVARARHLMRVEEADTRRYASLSELGPWGRREWWLTVVAFVGFVVGLLALVTA